MAEVYLHLNTEHHFLTISYYFIPHNNSGKKHPIYICTHENIFQSKAKPYIKYATETSNVAYYILFVGAQFG